jgi:hypothetical protein
VTLSASVFNRSSHYARNLKPLVTAEHMEFLLHIGKEVDLSEASARSWED